MFDIITRCRYSPAQTTEVLSMAHEKICFVIAPIGVPDSDTRKRSDQVLKHVIRPAAISCGYKAIRADQIDKPGLITSQVIQHIVTDALVVADLTERNPNVFMSWLFDTHYGNLLYS